MPISSSAPRAGVVIAAAGESRRMGGIDKVFSPLRGQPVLAWSVGAFHRLAEISSIALVLRADLIPQAQSLVRQRGWTKIAAIVPGGARRQDSVLAGLDALGACDIVLVHDGARPCVDAATILRGLDAVSRGGAAIAAVPAKNTIKVVDAQHRVIATPDRSTLWQVQTPQVFHYAILRAAYARAGADAHAGAGVTDDASLVEQAGHPVTVFMGSYRNIKVTTPEDLAIAEAFLGDGPQS
ncbi:MAG: 2-C-methyl-D-erythritol 4-phosphate cytidylyltransferase [Dehalococcoidia bacterium]|nr:2-C-methyl-D-erythritol 4-phosphate cytidylyltransferase [Dehalococcoidia bacterium]